MSIFSIFTSALRRKPSEPLEPAVLMVNAIRTPDGTVLQSLYNWHYVKHRDARNGLEYAVDGGLESPRRCGDGPYEELSLHAGDDFQLIRERFSRYNVREDRFVALKDMSDLWLARTVRYHRQHEQHLGPQYSRAFAYEKEFQYRGLDDGDFSDLEIT